VVTERRDDHVVFRRPADERVIAIVAVQLADIVSSPLILLSKFVPWTRSGAARARPLRLPRPVSVPEKGDISGKVAAADAATFQDAEFAEADLAFFKKIAKAAKKAAS